MLIDLVMFVGLVSLVNVALVLVNLFSRFSYLFNSINVKYGVSRKSTLTVVSKTVRLLLLTRP